MVLSGTALLTDLPNELRSFSLTTCCTGTWSRAA